MKYEYKENKTENVKAKTIRTRGFVMKITNLSFVQTLTSAYFSFAGFITKPLYLYYQSKLIDVSQINEIEINLGKARTAGFLRRR